jgi:hypothetical protein
MADVLSYKWNPHSIKPKLTSNCCEEQYLQKAGFELAYIWSKEQNVHKAQPLSVQVIGVRNNASMKHTV